MVFRVFFSIFQKLASILLMFRGVVQNTWNTCRNTSKTH